MLDKSAIELIQQSAICEALNEVVGVQSRPAVALPENYTVNDLESYQDNRYRFRGAMQTLSITDFAEYCKQWSDNDCFINAEEMSATSYFNLGDVEEPGHADNKALLSLKKTAAFRAACQTSGETYSQKELAEWIEDWRDFITILDKDDIEMTIVAAVASIRNVTIKAIAESSHSEHDFGVSRSAMEDIEAKSEQMPATIQFSCIPYDCLNERIITIRLSILTTREKPTFKARIVQFEQINEEMAQEFKEVLSEKLEGSNATLLVGSFSPNPR